MESTLIGRFEHLDAFSDGVDQRSLPHEWPEYRENAIKEALNQPKLWAAGNYEVILPLSGVTFRPRQSWRVLQRVASVQIFANRHWVDVVATVTGPFGERGEHDARCARFRMPTAHELPLPDEEIRSRLEVLRWTVRMAYGEALARCIEDRRVELWKVMRGSRWVDTFAENVGDDRRRPSGGVRRWGYQGDGWISARHKGRVADAIFKGANATFMIDAAEYTVERIW